MLDSVQLRLLIGPIVPLTPPRAVMDALTEVEVKVADVGQSGFKLTFSIDKQSPLQILFLLTGGLPLLFMRVVVAVVVNGSTNVLIDGVITDNNIAPGDKGSNSTLTLVTPAGETITYLARRIVPQPGAPNFATMAQHTVKQGDRLDLIAAKYLGDPLIFWLICDANGAIDPRELVATPGNVLNITTPQGVPGAPNAR